MIDVPDVVSEYRESQSLGMVMQEQALVIDVRRKDPEKYRPIPTHIPALNDVMHGFPTADPFYMLLFAEEKIGKSTVGMDFADAWRKGCPGEKVLYVQLEELRSQYAMRTFATRTSLTKDDIRMLDISDAQMEEIYAAANDVSNGDDNLYLQDDLFSVFALEKMSEELGCTKWVIDNLQLFDQKGHDGFSSQDKFSAISKHLVKMRNQKGYSFVVISQSVTDGKAFGSGQANRDADILIQIEYVYEGEQETPVEGLRRLKVLPSRISRPGYADVVFNGAKNSIAPFKKMNINDQSFLDLLEKEGPAIQIIQ